MVVHSKALRHNNLPTPSSGSGSNVHVLYNIFGQRLLNE